MTEAQRDPVNVLGELIEDAVTRYSGQVGTVASARVAEEVIQRLRGDSALAAAVLGDVDLEWGISDVVSNGPYPIVTRNKGRAQLLADAWGETVLVRRAAGPWQLAAAPADQVVPRG